MNKRKFRIAVLQAGYESNTAFAKDLGWHRQTLSNKLNNKRPFTEKDKQKIAEMLGKPVEEIFEGLEVA